MTNVVASLFSIAFISALVYFLLSYKTRRSKLPPGPRPKPIIGNLLDLPPQGVPEYVHWLQHKDKYGLISSIQIMGQTMVILHDQEATRDLLEKRSKVTSSRPVMEFAHNVAGCGRYTTSQSYNDKFRIQRKFMHQQLGTKRIVSQYSSVQRAEVGRLLLRVLEEPEKLIEHFKSEAGAVILKMTYGYSAENSIPDPLVRLVDRMMENFSKAFLPLAWPVDAIPVLKHVPAWLPGMSFKETGRKWNYINDLCVDIPYSFTRREMNAQNHSPSLVSRLVEEHSQNGQLRPEDEEAIKLAAATLYGGGADTTVSSLTSFVLAMTKFPHVQRKAQEEIDMVVGQGRLPQFEDQEKLPYVQGVVKEVLRWLPVAGMGIPHSTEETIEYQGYTIPKGTILMPVIWWFLHDPAVYKNPDQFDPTRYMQPRNERDPNNYCFGFGRRTCPGQYVAESSIFLAIAQLLACFDVSKALDESGSPIEPQVKSTAGLICHPQPFSFTIKPRSMAHRNIIESLREDSFSQTGDSDKLREVPIIEAALREE